MKNSRKNLQFDVSKGYLKPVQKNPFVTNESRKVNRIINWFLVVAMVMLQVSTLAAMIEQPEKFAEFSVVFFFATIAGLFFITALNDKSLQPDKN